MCGQWWHPLRREYKEFIPEIKAFQSVKDWGRLTDNFMWSSYAVWDHFGLTCQDWFNDEHWDIIRSNVRIQARVAKECGFKGILFDVEQYNHHGEGPWHYPFNYNYYTETGYKLAGETEPRSLDEVSAKVRDRAREYAETLCDVYPGITLIIIPAIYRPSGLTADEILQPSFFDGLLLGLNEEALLVLGTEYTYTDSQYCEMARIRDGIIGQMVTRSKYPELMRKKLSIAVGIWTDAGHGSLEDKYSDTDASVNQRDPERHKYAVHNALAASGKYGWVYGEQSRFLTTEPTAMMRQYWQANIDGHKPQSLHWQPEPKWDMTDYSRHDKKMAAVDRRFWPKIARQGYKVVYTFPEFWPFCFDTEQRGRSISGAYPHEGWPRLSTLECWQSQSIKANGEGVYRTRFDAPADLDSEKQQVYLAFGGFPADNHPLSWIVVRLNGKGFGIDHLIDVTESIKPGASNFLAIEMINKAGPGGPLGHVKLVVKDRGQAETVRNTGDKK